jgi:hypothetical protein
MGPGGRLRPAPRIHRNAMRIEPTRPPGFMTPRAPDAGHADSLADLMGTPSYETLAAPQRSGMLDASRLEAEFDLAQRRSTDEANDGVPARVEMTDEAEPSPDDHESVSTSALLTAPTATAATILGESFEDERPARTSTGRGPRPFERGASHGAPAAPSGQGSAQARPPQNASERTAPACTAPQLRRFIKSRAYVPMHELRRRFAIDGGDDDVTGIPLDSGRIYVGLPTMEGQLLGDLVRAGEIGFELSMDPQTPVVVGVYAMRPVPRP